MSTQSDLAELYTTFFNRAPDAAGLTYWVNEISTGKLSLSQVAKNWTTQQAEGLASLPSTLTNTQFIEKIYTNILGRTADTGGSTYWLNQLNSGAVTRDTFALSVINGAKANTTAQGVLDTTLINNKATVGVAFANKGVNDTTLAGKVLTSVTANADTLASTLAVISLLPATATAQTPAILSSANAVLTKFAALITAAPGEVADAATYLKALVAGATSTTNIGTLLDNANTLLTSAATNPAALDNPAAQGNAAVVVATPSTGGGGTAPATLAVTESGTHELNFTGTATGDITLVSLNGNNAVFARGGVTATSVSLATVTTIENSAPLSLKAAQVALIAALLQASNSVKVIDTAANINTSLAALVTNAAKIDSIDASDNGTITLNQTQLTSITSGKLSADDTIVLADTSATINTNIATLLTDAKIDSILSTENNVALTLTAPQAVIASNSLKLAAANLIVVSDTSANINTSLALLLGNAKVDTIQSTENGVAITLTAGQAALPANTAKLATANLIAVSDTSAAITTNLVALLADAKVDTIVSTDNPTTITLTADQAALPANVAKLTAVTQITVVDTSANINTNLAALLAATKVVTIDSSENVTAINLTAAQAIVSANTDKLVTGDQITVVDTSSNINANLTALLANAKVDTIDSSNDATAIVLAANQATNANFAKLVLGDTINVVDSGANIAGQLGDLVTSVAKVGNINASDDVLTLTAVQGAALGAKLTAADVVTFTNTTGQTTQTIAAGFQSGTDKLQFTATELTTNGFVSYTGGNTKVDFTGGSAEFVSSAGAVASSGEAAFLFNTTTNTLSYDADGTGAGTAVTLLVLTGVPTLVAGDLAFA